MHNNFHEPKAKMSVLPPKQKLQQGTKTGCSWHWKKKKQSSMCASLVIPRGRFSGPLFPSGSVTSKQVSCSAMVLTGSKYLGEKNHWKRHRFQRIFTEIEVPLRLVKKSPCSSTAELKKHLLKSGSFYSQRPSLGNNLVSQKSSLGVCLVCVRGVFL